MTHLKHRLGAGEPRRKMRRAFRLAAEGIEVAGLLPAIGGAGEFQRESSAFEPGRSGKARNLYLAGFDAAWEHDFFGGGRRSVETAKSATEAAFEGIRDARVSIAAEVAADYI